MLTVCLIALMAALLLPTLAWAEEGFDLQQFSPMPDQSRNFFSSSSASVAAHGQWQGFLLYNFGNAPLVLRNDAGERQAVVGSQATLHVMGSVGIFDLAEVGLDLPFVLHQSAGAVEVAGLDLTGAGFGLGDVRLVPKVKVFDTRSHPAQRGYAFAVVTDLYLPFGNAARLQGGELRGGARLAFDATLFDGVRFAANIGYLMRPSQEIAGLEVGDAVTWAVGGELPVAPDFRLTTELVGKVGVTASELTVAQVPVEFLGGARYQRGELFGQVGAGFGLVSGFGTPNFRGLLSVGYAPAGIAQFSEGLAPSVEPEEEEREALPEEEENGVEEDVEEEFVEEEVVEEEDVAEEDVEEEDVEEEVVEEEDVEDGE